MQLLKTHFKVKQRSIDAVIAADFAAIEYCNQLQYRCIFPHRPM